MAKRKEDPPPAGAPAWQSTFADLMNLLLCFFVLLFSMSNMDAQKFEQLAASFSNTFSVFSGGGSSFDDGLLISNGMSQLNDLSEYITNTGASADEDSEADNELKEEVDADAALAAELEAKGLTESEQMADMMREALSESGKERDVEVEFTSQYVMLTLKGSVLFDSGQAELKSEATPIVSQVGVILERYGEYGIEIEGHTDNVPLNGGRYENNDVLSSYRALAMFNYLKEEVKTDVLK